MSKRPAPAAAKGDDAKKQATDPLNDAKKRLAAKLPEQPKAAKTEYSTFKELAQKAGQFVGRRCY